MQAQGLTEKLAKLYQIAALRNSEFHIYKIKILPIRNQQNRPNLAWKCGRLAKLWAEDIGE